MHNDHRIPTFWNYVFILLILVHCEINKVGWGSCLNRPLYTEYFSSYDFCREAITLIERDLLCLEFLILGLTEFILLLQVDPKLESICRLSEARGHLSMYYSFTSCHPLNVSRTNSSLMSLKIFMHNGSRQQIRHSLESSMRMIRKSCWQCHIEPV